VKQIIICFFLLWSFLFSTVGFAKENITALVFSQSRPIPQFELKDNHGKVFNNASLKNHWTLMFFGFTHCQDLCPTTLSMLNKAYNNLEKTDKNGLPQVVFVTIDPKRDNVTRMNTYVSSFNKHFIGLTGSQNQITALTQAMGILAMPLPGESDIDHSGAVLLINPKGQLHGLFGTPHDAQVVASDFQKIQSGLI